ncbi:MAG TPA: HD domain-containing phosphohydrolase [bacterium]|nr:HD domain-containing phosphohydrolase [bacterium]
MIGSRWKALIAAGAVIVVLGATLYGLALAILLPDYVALEHSTITQDVERVRDALLNEVEELSRQLNDWAAWDDTYAYVARPTRDYVDRNLPAQTFEDLRLDVVAIVDRAGMLVYGRGFDRSHAALGPLPAAFRAQLAPGSRLVRHASIESEVRGILLLPAGPLLAASRPILTSEREGPIRGTMVWGRAFSAAEVARLAQTTHLKVAAEVLAPSAPGSRRAGAVALRGRIEVAPVGDQTVVGSAILPDIAGRPALRLSVSEPRSILAQGRASIAYFMLSFLGIGLASGALTVSLYDRLTASRRAKEAEGRIAEARIRLQLDRLAALRMIDTAITASLELRVTLDVLLDQVVAQLGVDAADVLLLERPTGRLTFVAGRGFRTNALQYSSLRLGDSNAGRAALERTFVAVPDLLAEAGGLTRSPLLTQEAFVSYHAAPLIAKGEVLGVLEVFHRTRFSGDAEWMEFLQTLSGQAAVAIDNSAMFQNLQRANLELSLAYDATLEGWSRALDLRDEETEGHTQRVTDLTLRLADAMGVTDSELIHIRRGALLHDIGKMGIPDAVLLKPGPLTADEREIIERHPTYAFALLSPIPYLRKALDIPYCHHEKWDGTGYPRGLVGENIPLAARIFAMVDVWDALTSDRPYRKAWPRERALEYVKTQSGAHFDPQVVSAFLTLINEDSVEATA